MGKRQTSLLAWAASAAVAAMVFAAEPAEDAVKAFNTLYGEQIAKATASPTTDDDVALAEKLVAAAGGNNAKPALVAVLCQKAYDLSATDAKGYLTAIQAMQILGQAIPEERDACDEKVLDVYQNRYAGSRGPDKIKAGEDLIAAIVECGDVRAADGRFADAIVLYHRALPLTAAIRSVDRQEIKAKLDYANTRQGFLSQAEKLKAVLAKDPSDQAARDEFVRIYVAEFDDPKGAMKQLDLATDDVSAKYVLLAGMSVERLPPRALAELGNWYRGLAVKSSAQGRFIALMRAKRYYERYLEVSPPADPQRDTIVKGLAEADGFLAKTATAAPEVTVLDDTAFNARFGRRLPAAANVGAGERALASSHWGERRPENVFKGSRTGAAWTLNGPKGWFLARWDPAPRGRYLVLFGRDGKPGSDAWGNATVSVNGNRSTKVEGMSSGRTLLVDLGLVVPVSSLRVEIDGSTYPGLAGVEVHAKLAAPAGDTESVESPF